MNLLKMFSFKGLYQNGNRMNQPLGYFRRFTNAWKDRTGRIQPFRQLVGSANTPADAVTYPLHATTNFYTPFMATLFQGEVFQLIRGSYGGGYQAAFKYGANSINQPYVNPVTYNRGLIDFQDFYNYMPSDSYTTAKIYGKIFVCESVEDIINNGTLHYHYSNIFKFDKLRVTRAGLPTPWAAALLDIATGDRNMRTVYVSMGIDGEPVFSNYLETPFKESSAIYYNSNKKNDGSAIADTVTPYWNNIYGGFGGSWAYHPEKPREADDSLSDRTIFTAAAATIARPSYYDLKHAKPLANPAYGANGITCQADIFNIEVGDWVMHIPSPSSTSKYGAFWVKCTYKVLSAGSTYDLRFDHVIRVFTPGLNWEELDLRNSTSGVVVAEWSLGFSNLWAANWIASNLAGTTDHLFHSLLPMFWGSNHHYTAMNYASFPGVASPILGVMQDNFDDWYDTNNVKTTFPPVIGITSYNNLLVGFDRNALYWSDTTFGGSTEMVSGNSNLVPPGEAYGKIMAVVGTEDFILVSRERRNYIIRGDLPSGNIFIAECDEAVAGAINARAVSNVLSGKAILVNKDGVFSVGANAEIVEISKDIRDLFLGKSVDGNLFQTANMIDKTAVAAAANFDGSFIKIALEESRGFIVILTGRMNNAAVFQNSNVLVYDTKDQTWYEWETSGMSQTECVNGKVILYGSQKNTESLGAVDMDNFKQLLVTTWITLDQPSLEKQVTQLKFYGPILNGANTSLKIGQQNDFQPYNGTATTSYNTYASLEGKEVPTSSSEFVHKKRLNSSKPQATSIILATTANADYGFELEGMELELDQIQGGVKK